MPDASKVGEVVGLKAPNDEITRAKYVGYFPVQRGRKKYVRRYSQEGLKHFANVLQTRVDRKWDCLVICTGPERSGKTTAMIRLARLIDPDFPLENICFRIENFNQKIHDAGVGEVIIFDEAGHDMFAQEWWSSFQRNLVKKLQVIGKKRLVLILNLPHKDDLNKKIRSRRVTHWAYVKTMGPEGLKRGYLEISEAKTSRWKSEIYWNPLWEFKFKKLHDEFWRRYEEKKDEFIEEVSSGKREKDLARREERFKTQRNDLVYWINKEEGWATQKEIAEILDMSRGGITDIVTLVKDEKEEEENVS